MPSSDALWRQKCAPPVSCVNVAGDVAGPFSSSSRLSRYYNDETWRETSPAAQNCAAEERAVSNCTVKHFSLQSSALRHLPCPRISLSALSACENAAQFGPSAHFNGTSWRSREYVFGALPLFLIALSLSQWNLVSSGSVVDFIQDQAHAWVVAGPFLKQLRTG